jgi:NADH-quinone oxidoreductase subunit E
MSARADDTTTHVLSEHVRRRLEESRRHYPEGEAGNRSLVLEALRLVQEERGGWLNGAALEAVASYLELPLIEVTQVARFYSMYELEPVGRHSISVCTNLSCHLCGGETLLAQLERRLGIRLGETTADGRFTLKKEEECLAACTAAPVLMIDHHYYERVREEDLDRILEAYP